MTTDEKEAEALRLLEEVARERHDEACETIHCRLVGESGRVLELIDRGLTSASSASLPSLSAARPE